MSAHRFTSLGHPSKFQRVSSIGFVTAATLLTWGQSNFAWCLAVSWAGTVCIYFRGFLIRSGILLGAMFTLSPKLALSYFDSVTAQHSSSGRQQNFAALSRGCHLYSAGRPSRWALAHILVAFVQQAFSSPELLWVGVRFFQKRNSGISGVGLSGWMHFQSPSQQCQTTSGT